MSHRWLDGVPIDGLDAEEIPQLAGHRRIIVREQGPAHCTVRMVDKGEGWRGSRLGIVQRVPKTARVDEDGAYIVVVQGTLDYESLEFLAEFVTFLQEEGQFGPADVVTEEPPTEVEDTDGVTASDSSR